MDGRGRENAGIQSMTNEKRDCGGKKGAKRTMWEEKGAFEVIEFFIIWRIAKGERRRI